MVRKASKRREERYLVLRSLFWEPRYFKALVTATNFEDLIVTRALGTLINNGDVKKKKIYIEEMSEKEISELRITSGVLKVELKTKRQFTHIYLITDKGNRKLAFWDYKHGYFQTLQPVNESQLSQRKYVTEMGELIEKQSFFSPSKSERIYV